MRGVIVEDHDCVARLYVRSYMIEELDEVLRGSLDASGELKLCPPVGNTSHYCNALTTLFTHGNIDKVVPWHPKAP